MSEDREELEATRRELREARAQQAAVAEILKVIGNSSFELEPTLEAIAAAAVRVCEADGSIIWRRDGDEWGFAAGAGTGVRYQGGHFKLETLPKTVLARCVAGRTTIHSRDPARDGLPDPEHSRTRLGVPVFGSGEVAIVIIVLREAAGGFSDREVELVETFADQAGIAIQNVQLFNTTTEALAQQTAVAEVLKTISRSALDLQSVLDTVVENAAQLCDADAAWVTSPSVERRLMAFSSGVPLERRRAALDIRPTTSGTLGVMQQVYATGKTSHIPDIETDPELYAAAPVVREMGGRTVLAVPVLREGHPIAGIVLTRGQVRPFSDREVKLAETFASQAGIAIENVRLFNETKEALERQTATGEILRVISGSPTDLQPVLDAIAESAARFCAAEDATLVLQRGGQLEPAAHDGVVPLNALAWPADRSTVSGRCMLERRTIHLPDVQAEADEYPRGAAMSLAYGFHTIVATPVLREGVPIGAILLRRTEVRPFSDKQIDLLRTFADQAAIAIENVRLFNETKEALERQTALAEILRVISRSPTHVQPVLDAIVENALRFCAAEDAAVMLPSGDHLQLSAHRGAVPAANDLRYPNDGTSVSSRAFLEARTIAVQDLQTAIDLPLGAENARAGGYHAIVGAPLLQAGAAVGVIVLRRFDARPFSEREIGALETFAAQTVIAIENVRLFNETKEALERQTATAELLTVISRSASDLRPVFDTIVQSVVRLCGADFATFWRPKDDGFAMVAGGNPNSDIQAMLRSQLVRPNRGSVIGRAALERRIIHLSDAFADPEINHHDRTTPTPGQARSALGVPIVRGDEVVGIIGIGRDEVRPFSEAEVGLVQTFADQAAIAIENVRLFNEIREKSAQLEVANDELGAASRHKSEFMANMSHELRTPLNAIIGFSEVLEQRMFGELNERQAEYTHDIATSGRHLLTLVNEILDLAKVEAGRMELEPSAFAPAETIRGALAFVRERAAEHRITLESDPPEDLGTLVADERKFRQVLLNLLSNAVKFTPDGGRVTLRALRRDGELEVAVQDTGIGIAPEDLPRVFEEFQQVGTTTERSREGTGLGLTLAKRFVELHGGRIWVESEVGVGTTFSFAIPVDERPADPNWTI